MAPSFLWVGALLLPCFSHGQNVVQQWNHLVRDVLVQNKIDLSNVSSPIVFRPCVLFYHLSIYPCALRP